jgi:hypothetical protein
MFTPLYRFCSITTAVSPGHYCSKAVNRLQVQAEKAGDPDPFKGQTIVYGKREDIPTSRWKLNLVAKHIRGMMVQDAMAQLEFSPKKAAQYMKKVLVRKWLPTVCCVLARARDVSSPRRHTRLALSLGQRGIAWQDPMVFE